MREHIRQRLGQAVERATAQGWLMGVGRLDPREIPVEVPRDRAHGDFASTIAMVLARKVKEAPRAIAEVLARSFEYPSEYINTVEVAGPGFINFGVNTCWLHEAIIAAIEDGESYGRIDQGGGLKVQIEFVSANPTGPMNVVNARAAAVGDVLANLFDFAGYDVSREYYINDAGNQVDVLGESCEIRMRQLMGEDIPLPERCYKGEYISDLARRALEEHGEEIRRMDPGARREFFKEFALKAILEWQKASLERFGVRFDTWFSERVLVKAHEDEEVLDILRKGGFLYEKDGAVWFRSTDFGDDKDRVVVKSDGTTTYLLRDLAYHRNKFRRGFEHIIDIWGPDHHGYVARTRAGIQAMGYPPEAFEVLLLQLVTLYSGGEQVRMSKRAGEFITMDELIDDVGKDAARYFFVTRSTDSHLDFDLELARKESQENPVYYIQYAHARIASILRQASSMGISERPARLCRLDLLDQDVEKELARMICLLPDEVAAAVRERAPNRMARYALDLAGIFHNFYNKCRVIGEDEELMQARLALVRATKVVLANVLRILGISQPERM
ncbi:MAG TPA: arginine--tRNA ligase [Firmicutes bacterium]|nr:arginine--tRNA ligase [Bacillota bacterium]